MKKSRNTKAQIVSMLQHYDSGTKDTTKLNSVSKNLKKEGYYLSPKEKKWSLSSMSYDELKHTAKTYNQKKWIPEQATKRVEILDIDERIANVKIYAIWGFDYLLMTKNNDDIWEIAQIL